MKLPKFISTLFWSKSNHAKIYCPCCNVDLNSNPKYYKGSHPKAGLETFVCSRGTITDWDFDAPVPLLVSRQFRLSRNANDMSQIWENAMINTLRYGKPGAVIPFPIKYTPDKDNDILTHMKNEETTIQPETAQVEKPNFIANIRGYDYDARNHEHGYSNIKFICYEHKEDGARELVHDGVTNEVLLEILIDRLGVLNAELPDDMTAQAQHHLVIALDILHRRTAFRMQKGVEGTNKQA